MDRRGIGASALPEEGTSTRSRRARCAPARWLARASAGALALAFALQAGHASAVAYVPSVDELSLLALTNEARADAGLRPLVWHDGLGQAARAHSTDMADNQCFQHNSCNGQSWSVRIGRYYPSWSALGENIALGGSDPRVLHEDWMASPGHRANILGSSYSEFGAGIALSRTNFGEWAYATEDFGDRGAIPLASIPTLPAGGVAPRIGVDPSRELFVNYYQSSGAAPQAVRALVGSDCVDLDRTAGSAANGTYGAVVSLAYSGCIPVVFEAIRADGVRDRWPVGKALLVGMGAEGLGCADTTTVVPTQDCGGSTTPSPTPTPGPTPDGNAAQLTALRVALRPGKAGVSAGTVSLQATLPAQASFDASSGPVVVQIHAGRSTDWQVVFPVQCGGEPCLEANARSTAFRGKVGTVTVGFAQAKDGSWKLRLSARKQDLGTLDAGSIAISLSVDGKTYAGSAEGELKKSGLFSS